MADELSNNFAANCSLKNGDGDPGAGPPAATCQTCKKPASLNCGQCFKVKYCSIECQRKDWKAHKSACRSQATATADIPLEIKDLDSEPGQRRVLAKKTFKAGEILWKETPLVWGPINTLNYEKFSLARTQVCTICCKDFPEGSGKKCSKSFVETCGAPKCLKDEFHKSIECPVIDNIRRTRPVYVAYFASPTGAPLPDFVFILRMFNLRKSNPGAWTKLMNLNPHPDKRLWLFDRHTQNLSTEFYQQKTLQLIEYDKKGLLELRTSKRLLRFIAITDLVRGITGLKLTPVELDILCQIFEWNSFDDEITGVTEMWTSHIKWISYYGSNCRHSCAPNVIWHINSKKQVVFRAIQDIEAGDELFIHKDTASLSFDTVRRRSVLYEIKNFICSCPLCKDPTELGRYTSAIHCFKPNCSGYLLMIDPLKSLDNPDWKCNVCNVIEKNSKYVQFTDRMKRERQNLTLQLPTSNDETRSLKSCRLLRAKLNNWSETIYHPTHEKMVNLKESLCRDLFLYVAKEIHGLPTYEKTILNCAQEVIQIGKELLFEPPVPVVPMWSLLRGIRLAQYYCALGYLYVSPNSGSGSVDDEFIRSELEYSNLERGLQEAINILKFYKDSYSTKLETVTLHLKLISTTSTRVGFKAKGQTNIEHQVTHVNGIPESLGCVINLYD